MDGRNFVIKLYILCIIIILKKKKKFKWHHFLGREAAKALSKHHSHPLGRVELCNAQDSIGLH